jgi:hypothetical protein
VGRDSFPSMTALSFPYSPFLQQPPSLYNHPPLFVIPSEAEGSAVPRTILGNVFRQCAPFLFRCVLLRWKRRLRDATPFLNGDDLICLNSRESLNQTIGPVNFQISMVAGSQSEVKPAIVH